MLYILNNAMLYSYTNILCVYIGLLSYTDSLEEGGGGRGDSNGYLNTISEKQKKGHNSDLLSGENNNSNTIGINISMILGIVCIDGI